MNRFRRHTDTTYCTDSRHTGVEKKTSESKILTVPTSSMCPKTKTHGSYRTVTLSIDSFQLISLANRSINERSPASILHTYQLQPTSYQHISSVSGSQSLIAIFQSKHHNKVHCQKVSFIRKYSNNHT